VQQLVASFGFDDRLRYYHNPVALGSPENWNAAVRYAQGAYIKILHHDDRLACPGSLSAFVGLLDEHPEADFAFGSSMIENVANGKRRIHRPTQAQIKELLLNPEELFFGNIIGAPSATIYRNGLGIKYDSRMKWLVDIDFYFRMLLQNKNFAFSPEVLIMTPTNAVHQVTEICKNNALVEINEYMLLYQKMGLNLQSDPDTRYVWFRLFEKYRIFSQKDLDDLGVKACEDQDVLARFFDAYRREWVPRLPYRVYAQLPEYLKSVIRCTRQYLMQSKSN
jgi:glycosyltransferase involved in cell wall biosynthesis